MKKITKILSSVLAASMVISAFAMNAFAASKAHTVTVSLYDAEGNVLESANQGDTITVELSVDNTADIISLQYTLNYDTDAFTAETTKVSKVEKCIDKTWLTEIKSTDDGDYWGYYLGNPVYNVTDAGKISFSWAGTAGIGSDDEADVRDNRVIGKFYLNVNDAVADGKYTIGLSTETEGDANIPVCNTLDAGENSVAAMISTPVTVTVGEPAPAQSNVEIDDAAATFTDDTFTVNEKTYRNAGAMLEFAVTENTIAPIKSISMTATDNLDNTNDFSLELPVEIIKVGSAKVALNILNVPTDVTSITLTNIVTSAN